MQIFFDIADDDFGRDASDELIDRFAINVTLPVGTTTERETYSGIFGLATVNISFTLKCAENFYDANCDRFCEENCMCGPGLTGPFCTTSIDDCATITCGENQRCVDGHLTSSCVCEPGYTGPDCLEDIDECAGVNCSFGTCEQDISSFTCVCTPGYSGELCERKLDSYQLQVQVHSVRNPQGRCPRLGCSNGCCEGSCPLSHCDYFLHYCQRPVGTPVSIESMKHQGNCPAINSPSERQNAERFIFSYSTLTLSGLEWVRSNTMCSYMNVHSFMMLFLVACRRSAVIFGTY